VADEIRKLASSTNEHARTVSQTLESTAAGIREALESVISGEQLLSEIDDAVGNMADVFISIADRMQELDRYGTELIDATDRVNAVNSEVENYFATIDDKGSAVELELRRVAETSEGVSRAISELKSAADEIRSAAADIAKLGNQNREAMAEVGREVDNFVIEEEPNS
jgi:methyl-accepting chemotaxis protein